MLSASDPIPALVEDGDDVKSLIDGHNFIPYAVGESGYRHGLLKWYDMLYRFSPSHNAAINKLVEYCFGGKATVVRSVDPEWLESSDGVPVQESEASAFREAIKTNIEFFGGVAKFHSDVAKAFKKNGNGWVEMQVSTFNGQTRIVLKHRPSTQIFPLARKKGLPKSVAFSKNWKRVILGKEKPDVIPFYPVFVDEGDRRRTIFQIKNGENDHWGRPDSEGADLYKYREFQDALYLVKQADANFSGQLIIEMEDDDPETNEALSDKLAQEAGYDNFVDRFEQNFTMKSDDPQSVLVTSRPYGSRPMFVFQISPNTNEAWYKVTGEMSKERIYASHRVTLRFMSEDVAGGFASNVFFDDYMLNMEPVIDALKSRILNFTNGILTAAWRELNMEHLNSYSIDFVSPISKYLNEYKNSIQPKNPMT